MDKNKIITRAFLDALGVAVYVLSFAWLVGHAERWFGEGEETWLIPAMMLIIFIVSACVTATLTLLKPILLFVEGKRREAVELFLYTVGFLIVMAIIIAALVF